MKILMLLDCGELSKQQKGTTIKMVKWDWLDWFNSAHPESQFQNLGFEFDLSMSVEKMGNLLAKKTLSCIHESSQTLMITPKSSKLEWSSSNVSRTGTMMTKCYKCIYQIYIKNGIWISNYSWNFNSFKTAISEEPNQKFWFRYGTNS